MFDISFSELAVVGVVALIVIGPERLPKVARTAGHLFGRLQRYVATVKSDIQREMDASELSKVKQEVTEAARAFEQSVQQQSSAFESEIRAIEQASTSPAPAPALSEAGNAKAGTASPDAGITAQANMLAQQESGLTAEPSAGKPAGVATPIVQVQGSFDFGIEPVRRAANGRAGP
jgi:sec-independent protein translocase protein TatB